MEKYQELEKAMKEYQHATGSHVRAEDKFKNKLDELGTQLDSLGYKASFVFEQRTNPKLMQPNVWMITVCQLSGNGIHLDGSGTTHSNKGKFEALTEAVVNLIKSNPSVEIQFKAS